MKKFSFSFSFKIIFLFLTLLSCSKEQTEKYYPEEYKTQDLIFPENDIVQQYEYSLIEAKVLTNQEITLYLKKQGIHLTYDDCCKTFTDLNAWDNNGMKDVSDYKEIYSNAKYNSNESTLTYKFPVQRIENRGYTVYHKLWIIDKNRQKPNLNIYFNYLDNVNRKKIYSQQQTTDKLFLTIEITCESTNTASTVTYINKVKINNNSISDPTLEGEISSITFEYEGKTYSPAIALHWTYYKIVIAYSNFSLKGNSLCDRVTNPCISGYYCIGGVCKKCHPSCYDCVNGGLSTDCYSKCNSNSALMVPDKGSCTFGYVDLNQFDNFDIEDIVPPPRNNRLTISFWMYINNFPDNTVTAYLNNSFNQNIDFSFEFSQNMLKIKCANNIDEIGEDALHSWIFVKCAISFDHDKNYYLYTKYFNGNNNVYKDLYGTDTGDIYNNCQHFFKKYYEPDDYISLHFYNFSQVKNKKYYCNIYMKQLVVFREFLPEPYDNKYFNMEKLLTSTLEIPELLFIIPFDEIIKEGNKYKIKCYSYDEKIDENEIILSPKESGDAFSLYPPKLFKRLNLLDKNKYYSSPDLINIGDLQLGPNTLIASNDNVPLSCTDDNFLDYSSVTVSSPNTYSGSCSSECPSDKTMIFGLGDKKGFCNRKCGAGINYECLNTQENLLNLKDKFKCKNDYYNIFYQCEKSNLEEQKKNIFYYDPNYTPANIIIDIRHYNLKSYIIEFWYHFADCGKITSGNIFYSNQIQIKKIETSYNVYTTAHDFRSTTTIYEDRWNEIALEVYYDPREERNNKTRVFVQTSLNSNAEEIDNSENPYPLDYIYFCNGRRSSCNNIELSWFCGYYRNLRLFNGVLSQRHVTFRYDEYYQDYQYLLSSIILYYPLYGNYISNNILRQYKDKLAFLLTTSETNIWNFPQYNYCSKPDIPCTKNNCTKCFNEQCFECENGYFLYKKEGGNDIDCIKNESYVFKLPTQANFTINIYNYTYEGYTVNFFIKVFGFTTTGKIDIIYLGDNLKISYNSNFDDPYFGLNLISFTGRSSETVISNYYNFRKHFGLWTFISVAVYNKTNDNFFPPMVRFEINQKKMPIVGTLDKLNIEKISFSNEVFALFQRLKIYKTYIIGAYSFETHKGNISTIKNNISEYLIRPNSTYPEIIYFEPKPSKDKCLFADYGIKAINKDNNEEMTEYECVPDDDEELLNFESLNNLTKFYPLSNEYRKGMIDNCYDKCEICIGNSEFNCSCNYKNNNNRLFLGNISDHYCQKLEYFDFAKAKDIDINFTIEKGLNKFTLHFWVFAYSYVDKVFEGLSIEWKYHTTAQVRLDSSGKYVFTCLINGEDLGKSLDFNMNQWNFLHCAVNYEDKLYYIGSENLVNEYNLTKNIPDNIINDETSYLLIKDLTNVRDWGILFYKHIRVWKDAFKSSFFLSRINIKIKYFDGPLLYQWNTTFNEEHIVYEKKNNSNFYITYKEDKIGTNIVPEEINKKVNKEPILCDENGQYYDRKTTNCINFSDISNIKEDDIVFEYIDVAYSHNYGIAFWILLEDHTNNLKPINFIWQYHMQISLQYDLNNNSFLAYCFPQNYFPYSVILANNDLSLEDKKEQVLNSGIKSYSNPISGNWIWIQCSLSYNNRYFYINDVEKKLIAETLYIYNNTENKNDEPLGYFYNGINDSKSKLIIQINANKGKKIYLRCFYLFKDYLPYNYNFKYMDMHSIGKKEFPPLTFTLIFKEYNSTHLFFKYNNYSYLDNLITPDIKVLEIENTNSKELSANFVFLPLCNPLKGEKFNEETQLCQEIDNCDPTALNCLYCMDENKPLVCKTNYYINIDSEKETVECLNYCQGRYYRSPGTLPTQGICGTDCLSVDVLMTCPNSGSSILRYQNDFACLAGFTRIGYQCFNEIEEPNKGALFYSGINYPYNIYQSFTNDFITLIGNGYILEFWFMIDNVIYNSTNFIQNEKYHYFNSKPHEIYLEKSSSDQLKYWYLFNKGEGSTDYKQELTDLIHQYEWNKILIFVDATISGIKEIRVIVNFDKENTKKFNVTIGDLSLIYIAFCSKDPELTYPECVSRGNKIKWASAYYNNIRIWNIQTANIDIIQSYINGIYTEYPQSLILFYPLNIKNLDNNIMTNIMGNLEEHIIFKCENGEKCALYNKDNIIIYNYSSKFDWGLLHKKQFVINMDGDFTMNISHGYCDEHCIRCYEENNIANCYECEEGYVLQYKECRNATQFYFLKTPSGSSINLVVENEDDNSFTDLASFTIVFWIKFLGVQYPTVTEYCRILNFDSNIYLAFQRSTNNLVLLENSKIVFRDTNFKNYFGIWIPISIANYRSNAQSEIYPNMFTLSVNKIDIPFSEGYSIPSTGIKVTQLQLGYEIIALFAELSIYSKFIQGGYGKIRSPQYKEDRYYYKSLIGNSSTNCLDKSKDLISEVEIICSPDYNVNFMEDYYCNNTEKFYNPYDNQNNEIIPDENKCENCHELCNTLCFSSGEEQCTCDMTDGIFWLRRNVNMQTYCEHIPYLDFSNIKPYKYIDAPLSKTKEYTIEFWFFVYSYNTETMNFKTIWIEWNFHNRLKLYNEQNSLKVDCQPIWRSYDFPNTDYPDNRQSTLKYYQWNYVKCGTDLKNKKYFLNTITEYAIKAKEEFFFDLRDVELTATSELKYFSIYRSDDFFENFGYVFIRELKLWQQYNLDFLDTKYINFNLENMTVDSLKRYFPGLLLYYKNEFNVTDEGYNPIITEIITGQMTIIGRDPDYVGYNIVDPENKGYAPLLVICDYGQVYNDLILEKCQCVDGYEYDNAEKKCKPLSDVEDELCEIYSNQEKQCFKCKDENVYLNKWLNEFEEKCYLDCPPTLFEDSLINQCRRCHETCYECTNENYNDCTSCTGELYFNFKENTCIPNCQTAGLTRSLTKPNICVIFDADASLVNVNTLTPIDVNTFDYIEAIVIQPTSSEYQTYWLFDAEKTNEINKELGFDDDIPIHSIPFTGDRSKLKVELDHNFFIINHKYVFGLKIYVENEGLEVPIYVWWTLTMNGPPYGGEVIVMPYLGLYNTTTFIMRCVNFLDENTPEEDLEYNFYYMEVNTNSKIKLSEDFSPFNEVYSNFTVRYYQLEYSNITIHCQVRDKYGAISEVSNVITIVNKKDSPLYILKQLVESFYIVDDALTDIQLLARAEVLMSLGINPFTDRVPSSFFTTYEASLTGEKVEIKDPQCITGYCNDNGDCEVIDVALTCKCVASFIGRECFLDKDGYTDLAYYYKKLYQRLMDRLIMGNISNEPINEIVFTAFYRLFFAAQNFFQEDSFFETNLIEFKSYLKQEGSYITKNEDRINKLLDLDEFFFNYFYIKETQLKLTNKINENFPFRNKTLTVSEYSTYQKAYQTFFEMIDEDSSFIIKNYGKDYEYKSPHFNYYLKKINEKFNDKDFFESLKTVYITYKPIILFMDCLREKNPTFNYYFSYVEYLVHPLSFDSTFYPNITAPLISIKIYDLDGSEVLIRNCPSEVPIKVHLPFNSYDWMNYINEQKWLFLPENYKLENDPIFRDPILIWENGSISSDTAEERIAKYYRYYNIVGLTYTPSSLTLYEYTSLLFKNISDSFLLIFETSNLNPFTAMIIPNIMNFVVDGRFYYIVRYKVLFYLDNHISNPVFYIWASLLLLFIFISVFFIFYDYEYFDQLDMLDFLQKEIIKVHFPYNQLKPGLNDENIYKLIPVESKLKKSKSKSIRKMFSEYNMEDIKENEENEEEDEFDENINKKDKNSGQNNVRTFSNRENATTRRELITRNNTNANKEDEEDIKEKVTEIRTTKRHKSNSKKIKDKNKEQSKNNPPRKKKTSDNEDGKYTVEEQLHRRKKESSKKQDNNSFELEDINKTYSKQSHSKTKFQKSDSRNKDEEKDKNNDKGYGDDEEDFNENNIIDDFIKSEKNTIDRYSRGSKQNFNLQALDSKLGFNKSKFSKSSKNSKKNYFYDQEKIKSNLISLQKFHNRSGRINVDNDGIPLDIINEEEERKKALEAFTRLSVTPMDFFLYNLKVRHILIAPFLNLTLFNNRWKKLIVLLTQFYIQQLIISLILTLKETFTLSNILGLIVTSVISSIISDLIVYLFVFLFETSTYQRKRLYRLVMLGERLTVIKAWNRLKRIMNCSLFFGLVIVIIIWVANLYITLIFTAVWSGQRTTWIVIFVLTVFINLVIGELLVEGICAFCYSKRINSNFYRRFGESLNRFRCYRTLWP